MAIITEQFYVDGRLFNRTYSDSGRYIVGGQPYGNYIDAEDPAEFGRTYTEGDIIPPDVSEEQDKAEAYDILMGVSE